MTERILESVGQLIGGTIGWPYLEFFKKRVDVFSLNVVDIENLLQLKGMPFIVAANHLIPESKFFQDIQTPPDEFVLERVIEEQLDVDATAIGKSDHGKWAESIPKRLFQKYIWNPVGRGFLRGAGLLPVNKNPGSLNRDIFRDIEGALSQGKPIITFPEGHWYEDFDATRPLDTGAANVSLRFKVPLLPTYIKGARSWKAGQEVTVAFGQPIFPGEFSKKKLTEMIRMQLAALQQANQEKA